ncbi:MAG: glycoside hydrolase family 65 protein, partial [Oscillospiraceae bacterium]|nr:glycoside hydrolase family 65 protein [Oscillospiraceae bacterium]
MDTWILEKTGYDPEAVLADGNRFLLANGYMGLRGTVEEAGRDSCPAVNLAGVYDRYEDRWREPVNAPNGLFCSLSLNGVPMTLGVHDARSHRQRIDYRHGVFSRDTDFGPVRLRSERIVSMAQANLMAAGIDLEFREDGEAEIRTGIYADIWDINGPHLFDFRFRRDETLLCTAHTGEKHIPVAVAQILRCDFSCSESVEEGEDGVFRILRFPVKKEETRRLELFSAVFTGLDGEEPPEAAERMTRMARDMGYAACAAANAEAWEQIWKRSAVELAGDEKAALALHASQYYLNSIAPRHAGNLSIPARGLSGQTYKGAIFWDSEIFFFPMFVHTQPELARSLLRYRIETLPGALKKAAEYGFRGAFYAWESQEGGAEGCTDFNVVDVFTHRPVRTYFRDKQIHISADIAYALRQFYEITGDRSLLEEGGAEVILQCARFYLSRASLHLDREEADFADVIGPDEYHERVTNNAFTNRMAAHCINSALQLEEVFADRREYLAALLDKLNYQNDWTLLKALAARIRGPKTRAGVIEQFDGYFALEDCNLETVRARLCDPREYWGGDHGVAGTTQIIKQADVIALMALLPEQFTDDEVAASWSYYEPRTEHGSSLSACMYALTACRIGKRDRAWELFMKTASIDIEGGGKQWAGEIYIGGTHPAANGGAWMIAALGFAGLRLRKGSLTLSPSLPEQISSLRFPVTVGGKRLL